MKKENFVVLINAILEQIEFEDEFTKDLQKYFDGHILSNISSKFITEIIKILEDEMNDKNETISWWLFEAPDNAYIEINNEKIFLYNPDNLYDFLINQK